VSGDDEIDRTIAALEALLDDPRQLAELEPERRRRLLTAAGRLSRPERDEKRKLARAFRKKDRAEDRAFDEAILERSGMREARREAVFQTPTPADEARGLGLLEGPELAVPRSCYVCKTDYTRLHAFYDLLCPACGDFNYKKRFPKISLEGRVALLTGGRVKIGYHTGILLLRAGARLIVTTRFPHDAANRYAREPDYEVFRDRLEIWGLDLRHTPSVEAFAGTLLERLDRLDFILHNACQTVRRPPGFYQHLLDREAEPLALPAARALVHAESELVLFPKGALDADLQQIDLRRHNSWRMGATEVSTVELLEVHLVNAIAPFVLSARLKPLMTRVPSRDKHVVNVSAMEGQFSRRFKTERHPHTNMAKAALNMLTRTSAGEYERDGIHMNSVDTGWVTDEDPFDIASRKAEEGFRPPLDVVDGAARIIDPIVVGFETGEHPHGLFFKDYRPVDW
jgi:NAD(P)-dependent dehydrogenase (short-subunit alcohol dehydrogenase family)